MNRAHIDDEHRQLGRRRAEVPAPARLSGSARETGRLIAGLLDGELERRAPVTEQAWAAHHLQTPEDELTPITHSFLGVKFELIAYAVSQLLPRARLVCDAEGRPNPAWTSIDLPEGRLPIPTSLRAAFPAGVLGERPAVVQIEPTDNAYLITLFAPGRQALDVVDMFRGLKQRGADESPFAGRVLEIEPYEHGLRVHVTAPPTGARDELILPETIWADIDRNVHGLLANRDALARLGLGLNRGLLLSGPPGTGKTQLVRTIIGELAGQVTTLLPSVEAMRNRLRSVYAIAQQHAPALVVLEDIDLVASRRSGAANDSIVEFLTTIDGVMTENTGAITVATTNDPRALDDAATRAARFDRHIEVPRPSAEARRRIWQRYLNGLHGPFDVGRLASATDGATGADIRELVRHAILDTDSSPTTETLLELARGMTLNDDTHGQYL